MVNEISKGVARMLSGGSATPASQAGPMMSRQKELKRLPVAPLQDTLRRYLESVQPLLTAKEFEDTRKAVGEFGKPESDGAKLYKILEAKAASTENWLSDWWLENAYLKYRMPVVVYSNPGMAFERQTFKSKEDQLKHAALLMAGALDFKTLIDRQLLVPETMGASPLDMSQYQKIFSTCRVPHPVCDKLETYLLSSNPPSHVLVIHNNQFFVVNAYDARGTPYDERQLFSQLLQVVEMSKTPGPAVGILTTEHRDVWAEAFRRLCQNPKNEASVEAIKRAIFVMCLDRGLGGTDPYEVACPTQMLVGGPDGQNAANRWCDKTVEFIVGEDGSSGLLYEHSPSEGPPVARLVDHCFKYMEGKGRFQRSASATGDVPKRLEFDIGPETLQDIEDAKASMSRLAGDMDLLLYKFPGYGKDFIKSCKLSPDSYVQMAMQLAFYKIHGVPGATYESASTRMFLHGRTETIRSTSSDSLAFCKAFENSASGVAEKGARLRKAVENHKSYTQLAVNGLGVDRLFLGLKLIAAENGMPLPNLFKDKGFQVSAHFRISSSQVATECDAVMFFGPLVPDGYGCCYNPQPHNISFGLSSFKSCAETSALRFRDALEESLTQMHDCLQLNQRSKL